MGDATEICEQIRGNRLCKQAFRIWNCNLIAEWKRRRMHLKTVSRRANLRLYYAKQSRFRWWKAESYDLLDEEVFDAATNEICAQTTRGPRRLDYCEVLRAVTHNLSFSRHLKLCNNCRGTA